MSGDPGRREARGRADPCMTVKLKTGEERLKKSNKRALGPEELEETAEVEDPGVKGAGEPLPETTDKDPQEALTPSQPPATPQDQHHFLRSSVRPHSKRIKKDHFGNAASTSSKSKAPDNATPSSTSCSTVAPSAPKASGRNIAPPPAEKEDGSQKKVRRQWESWSTEDKNMFFDALFEHGKDFEAIRNNIALKYKKKAKPASMVKNKEQIRHFYYRTWHKISKYIDFNNVFSCGLKKSSQELYGLICYGELRKKIGGCMDNKNAAKLNELIQLGITTVRYKGRNLRIKTPMCRALKKLCDPEGKTGVSDEEDQKPVRLPLKVPIELQPRNNEAWARVQSLAQNPRLRMIVELHRKVSSLIEFLKQKWVLHETRVRKTVEDQQQPEPKPQEPEEELSLFPLESVMLTPLPGVARVVHSKAFCTVHWQETGKCKQSSKDMYLLPPAQILGIQTGQGTARVQLKCPRGGAESKQGNKVDGVTDVSQERTQTVENGSLDNVPSEVVTHCPRTPDEVPPELVDSPTEAALDVAGSQPPAIEELSLMDPVPPYLKSCQNLIIPEESICTDKVSASSPKSPETLPTASEEVNVGQESKESQAGNIQPDPCTTETSGMDTQEKDCGSSKTPRMDSKQFTEHLLQEGWNNRTSGNLTLAEVYLMLGKPGKLQLEYEWLLPSSPDGQRSPLHHKQRLLNCLLRLISTELNPKTGPETASVATSPLKLPSQEQAVAPRRKVVTLLSRNPDILRTQSVPQIHATFTQQSSTSGFTNLPRPLLIRGPLAAVPTSSDVGVFAVPTMLPPNSRHTKPPSPGKESEIPNHQQLDAINSDFFLPKAKKPRSRHPRKPLVVQRTLLQRPSVNSSPHVCSFSILTNSAVAGRGSFRPIHSSNSKTHPIVPKPPPIANSLASAIDLAAKSAGIIPGNVLPVLDTGGLTGIGISGTAQESLTNRVSGSAMQAVTVCAENTIPFIALSSPSVQDPNQPFQTSSVLSLAPLSQNPVQNGPDDTSSCKPSSGSACISPPNVSTLLDISLPGPPDDVLSQGEPVTHISDSIIEIAISSGQFGEAVPLSPAKLNDSSKSLPSPSLSPQQNWIASPSHDPQWYPNDSTDSSLSSLFSSFISPEKGRKTLPAAHGATSGTSLLGPTLLDGSSRDSFVSRSLSDVTEVVDSQLACLMNENSIDYISRFNDLAQELSGTDSSRKESIEVDTPSVT
ncbi:protein cramped-like isoform X1 [Pelobates fuscus]|uniref:protein cramped-like isoform X1 n=2 Tax=Pelobates fuscus TaxID=191477 RepID=UPI002FE4B6FC